MRRAWGAALALALAACVPLARLPEAPVPAGPLIAVEAEPVPLDPADPARQRLGNFTYAGGVALTSRQTSRLHGLSDLKVWPDGRLLAVSDQSDLLEARIVLDATGRLAGLADARLSALKDVDGQDLYAGGQEHYDSEGVARLPGGDMIVAFEQEDRVLVFPRDGGLPRPAPRPEIDYRHNQGMESAAAAPDVAPDAYRVGLENSGQVYVCRLSGACEPEGGAVGPELVAMDNLPGGGRAYLFRTFSVARGNVVRLRLTDRSGAVVDEVEIARPLTVDNFEGLAAVARPDGAVRLYLIADDNFGFYQGRPTGQRTLLLAFDWRR